MKVFAVYLVLLAFVLVNADSESGNDEPPIPFPGVHPDHINCTGVHSILDQYCHTHKCRNLFTNYCYNNVNGVPPTCDEVLLCVKGRSESYKHMSEKAVNNGTKVIINFLSNVSGAEASGPRFFYTLFPFALLLILMSF